MNIEQVLIWLISFLFTSAITGVLLTVGVWIFNALSGAKKKGTDIPVPPFGRAMVGGFATCLVVMVVSFLLDTIGLTPQFAGLGENGEIGTYVWGAVIFMISGSLVIGPILKVSYPRAMGVALCWILGMMMLGIVFFLISVATTLAIGFLGPESS